MNSICRDIFRSIHEGKWIRIEYLNKAGGTTHYWIAVKKIDVFNETLSVERIT